MYKTLFDPRLRDQTLETVPGSLFHCETGAPEPQTCSLALHTTKVSSEIGGNLLRRKFQFVTPIVNYNGGNLKSLQIKTKLIGRDIKFKS